MKNYFKAVLGNVPVAPSCSAGGDLAQKGSVDLSQSCINDFARRTFCLHGRWTSCLCNRNIHFLALFHSRYFIDLFIFHGGHSVVPQGKTSC